MKVRQSVEVEKLEEILGLVRVLLAPIDPASGMGPRAIDLAMQRVAEWAESPVARLAAENPDVVHDGGAGLSLAAGEEAAERVRVARMAVEARGELPRRLDRLVVDVHRLANDVRRFVMVVDPSKLPKDEKGWCRHCARVVGVNEKNMVSSRAPKQGKRAGLCRACLDFESEYHDVPPVEWLQLRADGRKVAAQRFFTDWLRAREKKSA